MITYLKEKLRLESLPESILFVATFLIPFYFWRLKIGPIKTNIFEIAVILAFILFVFTKLWQQYKIHNVKISFGKPWPYLFLLVALISTIIAPDQTKAFGIFKGWFFIPVLYYFLIINIVKLKNMTKLAWAILISVLIVSIFGLLQAAGLRNWLLPWQIADNDLIGFLNNKPIRIFSFFESPNYLAMLLVPSFFISLSLLENVKSRFIYFIVGLSSIVIPATVWLSGSRGGYLALIFGGLYLLVKFISNKKSLLKYIIIPLVIVSLAASFFIALDNKNHPNSSLGRQRIGRYTLYLVSQNPIKGVGLGGYPAALKEAAKNDQEFLVFFYPYAYHPHNLFLTIWLNLGIAGLVLFFILLLNSILGMKKQVSWSKKVLIAAIIGIIIHGLFDTNYFKNDLAAIFWLIMAWTFLTSKDSNEQYRSGNTDLSSRW